MTYCTADKWTSLLQYGPTCLWWERLLLHEARHKSQDICFCIFYVSPPLLSDELFKYKSYQPLILPFENPHNWYNTQVGIITIIISTLVILKIRCTVSPGLVHLWIAFIQLYSTLEFVFTRWMRYIVSSSKVWIQILYSDKYYVHCHWDGYSSLSSLVWIKISMPLGLF